MPEIADILQNNPVVIVISFLAAIVTLFTFILSILKFRRRSHDIVTIQTNEEPNVQDRDLDKNKEISPGKWVGGGALFFGALFCFSWLCFFIYALFTSTLGPRDGHEIGKSFGEGFWPVGLIGALFGALLGGICWCVKEVVRRVLRT